MVLQHLRLAASLGLLIVGGSLAAFPAPETAPVTVAVYFHNGSVLRHVTLEAAIDIETRYGKITLQPSDIRRVEFAFRVPPEDQKKLDKALKEMAGGNFQERETATQDLIALGRVAYPALVKMAKAGGDPDTTRHAENVLEEIRKKVPGDQLKFHDDDMVQTADATLRGKLHITSLKVKAEVLGELQLPLGHLNKLRSTSGTQFVTLKPAGDQPWVQTALELTPGAAFEIKVSGTIHVEVKGSKWSTGPRGSQDLRAVIDSNVPHAVDRPIGLVSGRVGAEGSTFEIGKSFQGVATGEGRLFLQIYTGGPHEFPMNGTFQVEIEGN